MAEWLVEGLLDRLLDEDDGIARSLLDKAVFYVVPNYESGWISSRASANERSWYQPQQRMADAIYGKKPGSLSRHGEDEGNRRRFVSGCARR